MDEPVDLIDRLIFDWQRERPELDCRSMGIVGRIIHFGMLLRASASAVLERHDLSYTDLDILATLRRKGAPYRLTPTELGNAILLTSGAVTTAVGRLVDRGLVSRGKDPADGRVKTVTLTPNGEALVDKAIGDRFEEADRVVSALDGDETEILERLLRRLILSHQPDGRIPR